MSDVSHVYSCGVRFWTNEVWLWVGLPVKRLEENTQCLLSKLVLVKKEFCSDKETRGYSV